MRQPPPTPASARTARWCPPITPKLALGVLLALLAACAGPPRTPTPEVEPTCTLATPLVPGIPGSPGHWVVTEVNPNGQSELALLMRSMQADLAAARAAFLAGAPLPAPVAPHARMRCSWPTTPTDRTPAFDGFAQAYLMRLSTLEQAPVDRVAAAYEATLDACQACHQQTCPGPLMAIRALRLPAR